MKSEAEGDGEGDGDGDGQCDGNEGEREDEGKSAIPPRHRTPSGERIFAFKLFVGSGPSGRRASQPTRQRLATSRHRAEEAGSTELQPAEPNLTLPPNPNLNPSPSPNPIATPTVARTLALAGTLILNPTPTLIQAQTLALALRLSTRTLSLTLPRIKRALRCPNRVGSRSFIPSDAKVRGGMMFW